MNNQGPNFGSEHIPPQRRVSPQLIALAVVGAVIVFAAAIFLFDLIWIQKQVAPSAP
jgi:hypothetical protein